MPLSQDKKIAIVTAMEVIKEVITTSNKNRDKLLEKEIEILSQSSNQIP